jgi:hypothetical protein
MDRPLFAGDLEPDRPVLLSARPAISRAGSGLDLVVEYSRTECGLKPCGRVVSVDALAGGCVKKMGDAGVR